METVNVQGTDSVGALVVKVYGHEATGMNAVDRGRLYEAAPDLLAACKELMEAVRGHERRMGITCFHQSIDHAVAALAAAEAE